MNCYEYNFNNVNFKYYLRDDVDFSVFNEVFKIIEYKSCIDFVKNAQKPIIDIGAHVGFFSIFANCLNDKVKIYSIEPEKDNFDFLNKHKNENNFSNIKTFKCAIGGNSNSNGELFIAEDSINNKILKLKNSNLKTQNIRIFSLKDFFDDNKIDKVSLIKMDIEGGEYDILENMDKDTYLKIGAFIMEYHNIIKNQKPKTKNDIEFILRNNGFSVQVFPSKFDKDLGFIFAINKRLL